MWTLVFVHIEKKADLWWWCYVIRAYIQSANPIVRVRWQGRDYLYVLCTVLALLKMKCDILKSGPSLDLNLQLLLASVDQCMWVC